MYALLRSKCKTTARYVAVLIGACGLFMFGSAAVYSMCEHDPVPAGYAADPVHNELHVALDDTITNPSLNDRCAYISSGTGRREDQLIIVSAEESVLIRWCIIPPGLPGTG